MKNLENSEVVDKWIRIAEENLIFAKSGMEQDFAPYHSICFMAQNSGEKYLKAFLISKGWELEKIHDSSQLLEHCCKYDNSFQELYSDCEVLNRYIIASRYPEDITYESIGKKNAEEAIQAAENIEKFVLNKIKTNDNNNNFNDDTVKNSRL